MNGRCDSHMKSKPAGKGKPFGGKRKPGKAAPVQRALMRRSR